MKAVDVNNVNRVLFKWESVWGSRGVNPHLLYTEKNAIVWTELKIRIKKSTKTLSVYPEKCKS